MYFYLVTNKQANPQQNQMGGFWPNVSNGIRSVPVNGKVIAYHRDTGKFEYFIEAANQMLIVDQFRDLPILLFTTRSNRVFRQGFNQGMMNSGSVMSIAKRTGKLFHTKEDNNDGNLFFALNINPRTGTTDFIRPNLKITYELGTDDRQAARADGLEDSKGTKVGGESEKIIHSGAIIEKK
jgi:hypothetical protein